MKEMVAIPYSKHLYNRKQEDTALQLKLTKQLVMLQAASCNISSTLDNQQVEKLIVQEFLTILSASACFLGSLNEDSRKIEIVASHYRTSLGNNNSKPISILEAYPPAITTILARRNVLHISGESSGTNKNLLKVMHAQGVSSLLLLPLVINNQISGVIEILNASEQRYETYEIIIARLLANQAVIAIENAKLYHSAKQEILARQKTEEKLKYNALHDALTDLPNRILFLDRLQQAIARFRRESISKYAVLFVDLDRFKRVNDSFGHIEGDRALRETARRLKESVRDCDTVSRFGGDEFLILLEGQVDSVIVKEIVERIQKGLSEPILIGGHNFHFTASIGIAFCLPEVSDSNVYVRNANIAMYRAKMRGGGRAEIYTQTEGLAVRSRVILESSIRKAVKDRDFYFHFQPIYELETLSVIGLEALLRWERNGIKIPPAKFIPLVESFGLMPELGIWILETAIQNYQSWQENYPAISPITLSVNISITQLTQEDFFSHLTRILEMTRMNPDNLNLEVTEHVLIDDIELANKKVRELTKLGVKVHLDDFGTGYSSLVYLKDLPVQALKIDRTFVQQVNPSEPDQGLVSSILSMARFFDVDVIAEGIETERQLRALLSMNCKYGQGDFLSPAISEDKLIKLLKKSPFSPKSDRFSL